MNAHSIVSAGTTGKWHPTEPGIVPGFPAVGTLPQPLWEVVEVTLEFEYPTLEISWLNLDNDGTPGYIVLFRFPIPTIQQVMESPRGYDIMSDLGSIIDIFNENELLAIHWWAKDFKNDRIIGIQVEAWITVEVK